MNIMKKITLLLVVVAISNGILHCTDFATPISPGKPERERNIGLWLDFGQNVQDGTSYVDCENCNFQNGTGFGYTIGVSYEEQLSKEKGAIGKNVYFGAMLLLSNRDIEASYRTRESAYFPDYAITIPLDYREISTMSIMSIGLMPYAKYTFWNILSLQLGLDASYVVSNNLVNTLELLDRRVTLSNGEVVDVYIPSGPKDRHTYSVVKQDSEIKDIQNLQVSLVPAIEFNIHIANRWTLSPNFMYFIPLGDMSTTKDGFSVSAWRAGITLYYNLVINAK
ncbi:MAG: hypothetical protein LBO69_09890 [Ignavibacteria bacterium]|nr:hypothetical protein [Ignavibacteria bacterium]